MIAIIIVNYNSPKATDDIVEFLLPKVKIPYNIVVLDNGSDKAERSKYTTNAVDKNRNKIGGVLTGLHLAAKYNPEHCWTISTSMKFNKFPEDPARQLIYSLNDVRNSAAIIPGFTGEMKHKTHQAVRAIPGVTYHRVLMGVGPYAMFDSAWLDDIGWFDPSLTSSWGVDYELGYLAMEQHRAMLVSDLVTVQVDESGKYVDNLEEYQKECREEMVRVLTKKYGEDWYTVLRVEEQLCGI